jgi:hypothetical protein
VVEDGLDVYLPAKALAAVVPKLNASVQDAPKTKDLQDPIRNWGFDVPGEGPAEFAARLARERKRWEPVVKATGLYGDGIEPSRPEASIGWWTSGHFSPSNACSRTLWMRPARDLHHRAPSISSPSALRSTAPRRPPCQRTGAPRAGPPQAEGMAFLLSSLEHAREIAALLRQHDD